MEEQLDSIVNENSNNDNHKNTNNNNNKKNEKRNDNDSNNNNSELLILLTKCVGLFGTSIGRENHFKKALQAIQFIVVTTLTTPTTTTTATTDPSTVPSHNIDGTHNNEKDIAKEKTTLFPLLSKREQSLLSQTFVLVTQRIHRSVGI